MFQVLLPRANVLSVTRVYLGSRVLPVCFFWEGDGIFGCLYVCLSICLPV